MSLACEKVVSSKIIHHCCHNFLNNSSQLVLSAPDHGDGGGGECVQCDGGAAQLRPPRRGPQRRGYPDERDEDEEPLRRRPHRLSQAETKFALGNLFPKNLMSMRITK